jgi:hypothetical protein
VKKPEESKVIRTFADVLSAAEPRPESGKGSGPYATKFANQMAVFVANGFRSRFPEIKPDATGKGVESKSRAVRGLKKLDVNYSTQQAGLLLGISLKSVHFSENASYRFHHNCKRNDEELRVEAAGYHQRQPYAVLVAIVVLPFEACEDADARPSSFGKWVQYLWPLAGRSDPHGDLDRFEHVFVALYDPDPARDEVVFFDVTTPPPRAGRPTKTLSLEAVVATVSETYAKRNSMDFSWETGERDPLPEDEESS